LLTIAGCLLRRAGSALADSFCSGVQSFVAEILHEDHGTPNLQVVLMDKGA
jgi:hypothetical protein